ncbi:TlpA disulfide reductase family protein [Fontimonas sp. SYSU GA230001]|uniref:TlpA family protein disulfide reductase n=1 Tax=Fontimonas sp. SYSU GA230001 TaxID=3142450 RepID=UPI0032B45A75
MRRGFLAAFVGLLLMPALALAAPPGGKDTPQALKQFAGKVVYVDFWASWCAPCAESFPWLNTLQDKYGSRLVVVGVNVDENQKDADRFLQRHPARFAILRDPKGELAAHYDIPGMPTSLILDENGALVHLHSGFRNGDIAEYEAAITRALSGAARAGATP